MHDRNISLGYTMSSLHNVRGQIGLLMFDRPFERMFQIKC
jgi:hypothetical protein